MFQIGDLVTYGIHGVCRIADQEERTVEHRKIRYLVLTPLEQTGARFLVPTHNEAALSKLRRILTREELEALLRSEEVRRDTWIADENQRKQRYRELIGSGDRTALLQMIGSILRHRESQTAAGRKLHLCDDNFLRDAERLINGEFSLILGIDPGQVGGYVRDTLRDA